MLGRDRSKQKQQTDRGKQKTNTQTKARCFKETEANKKQTNKPKQDALERQANKKTKQRKML